ncbi:MAG: KH domain-containing protein [Leptolyngbyaceae cyanobacterium]
MPEDRSESLISEEDSLDYGALVRFLIEPFLETPDALRVDCEMLGKPPKVLVRVAFSEQDRGRVFGRGGRNIQAVRTVLKATAQLRHQVAHLDIYGENRSSDGGGSSQRRSSEGRSRGRRDRPRPSAPRPQRKEG